MTEGVDAPVVADRCAIFPLIDDDRMLTVFITCNSYDINTYHNIWQ